MIESKLKPFCNGCPALDPQVATAELYAGGEIVERVISLECSNIKLCEQIEKYLKSKKEGTS